MSVLKTLLAPWLTGATLLLAAAPSPAMESEVPTLRRIEVQGPAAGAELDTALAALSGRPLDELLIVEAAALIEDFYGWLEWRDVDIAISQPEDAPGELRIRVDAQPPLPAAAPPAALEETPAPARPKRRQRREEPIVATDYDGWLHSPARVLVDAAQRRLFLKRGPQVASYAVAVGTQRTPTPPGVYRVEEISHRPTWYPTATIRRDHAARGIKLPSVVPPGAGNPLGAWFVRLQDSIGIHGTNEPASIGQASSYGCVRMRDGDLEELARALRPGDRVLIIGRPPEPQQISLRN